MRLPVVALLAALSASPALAQEPATASPASAELPGLAEMKAAMPRPVLAPGTPAGARAIRAALIPYVTAEAFESGIVAITPVSDGYRIDLSFQDVLDSLADTTGIAMTVSDYALLISEQPDGQWYVSISGPLAIAMKMSVPQPGTTGARMVDRSLRMSVEDTAFEGYFDPNLFGYTRSYWVIGTVRQTETTGEFVSTSETGPSTMVAESREGGNGTVDMDAIQTIGATRQAFDLSVDPANPDRTIPVLITSQEARSEVTGEGFESQDLGRLLPLLVELSQEPERPGLLKALQAGLTAALPVFEQFAIAATIAGAKVDLGPFGSGEIAAIEMDVDMDGAETSGAYSLAYDLTGVSVASPFIPAWASPLVPERLRIELTASDIDLANPARTAIENLRLDADAPLIPSAFETMAQQFEASGPSFGISDSLLSGKDYTIDYSAAFKDGATTIAVETDGLDRIIAHLQAAGADVPEAMQGVSFLQVAKGFAKPFDDGRHEWIVHLGADGSVTVNGAMLKAPAPEPLPGSGNLPPAIDRL
ncbi:hypothetical protein U0C82_04375 [Fulvimarina sp. 2208YS6-2-32]|uniref:DUF2125 domain-containing protein n=1 Tax=Fulvimarina uroteuthidis TaxID=3098149 RepID=A0ABU5HZ39_9HYPH|nr:hypothetical protein [Fulvimarina sp. 2208YS6-2-32]MDY8108388.1 hypothetical protein [Fulvimarina sp. 2208YS6-2-32]